MTVRQAAGPRLVPLLAVSALLVAAAVAASLATPQLRPAPLSRHRPPAPTSQPQPDQTFRAIGAPDPNQPANATIHLPSWVDASLIGLGLVLLGAAVVLVILLLRRRIVPQAVALPEPEDSAQAQRERVLAAVGAGLAELDDGDPRAAVIACWVRLEQAAAEAGTARQPGDTPTELVLRLLSGHQVDPDVLYRLAEVYRLARYATHTVDVTMRDQARAALRQLHQQLSRPVAEVAR